MDLSIVRHGVSSGTAVYAYRLAEALLKLKVSLVLYCGSRCSPAGRAALETLEAAGASAVTGPAPWRWSPDAAWWLPAPRARALLASVDVFHVGEFFLPRSPVVPCVATVHDLTVQRFPEYHQLWNRWLHRRRLRWIKAHAARVIVVSDATRRDLLDEGGVDPARIDRIYEARGHGPRLAEPPDAVLRRYGLEGVPYILMVGTIEPRKNHVRAVHAFNELAEHFPRARLVLAGSWGWRAHPIREAIDGSPVRARIDVLGEVPAADIMSLYVGARVFAFPSLYEGFGLPLLEAMSAGAPILTSNTSSMPEVAGDAALYADPTSVESIRNGLERLLRDDALRRDLADRGRRREADFTWRRAAEETLASYRRAVDDASTRTLTRLR